MSQDCIGFDDASDYYFKPYDMDDYNPIVKPILRPMYDLYKPCLEDGKIPIVELAKIAFSKFKWNVMYENEKTYLVIKDTKFYEFGYSEFDRCFFTNRCNNYTEAHCVVAKQLDLFQKLYEWHFDVNNLIEQDLAVDINDLKE